jgi:hypothetical protein
MAADERLNVTVPHNVEDEDIIKRALDSTTLKNGAS